MKWASAWQNLQNCMCAQRRLRVFAVRMKKVWVFSFPFSAQQRLWSYWPDAQADLSLCRVHMPFCRFCHALAQIIFQPLELLWKLLEEWLLIIQVEFESSEPVEHRVKSPESLRMVSSAPPHLFEAGPPPSSDAPSNKEKMSVTSPTMTVHVTEARLASNLGEFGYMIISENEKFDQCSIHVYIFSWSGWSPGRAVLLPPVSVSESASTQCESFTLQLLRLDI